MHFIKRDGHYHFYYWFNGKAKRISGRKLNNGNPIRSEAVAKKYLKKIQECLIENLDPLEQLNKLHQETMTQSFSLITFFL